MKAKQKTQIAHLFLFIYLSYITCSCQVIPTGSYVKYTKLEDYNCDKKAENIFVFFENEDIDFKYKKLGFVQINQAVNTENAINLMKQKTQEMCGNALVNFKIDKTSEVETDENQNVNTTIHTTYSAISVKIDENSEFWKQNKEKIDTSFINNNKALDELAQNNHSRFIFGSLIFVTIIVVLLSKLEPVD